MRRALILIIAMLMLSGCSLKASKDFSVNGKVARAKKPVSHIDVYAYKAQSLLDFSKPDSATKTDDGGLYHLNLTKEGDYYITAKTMKSGSDDVEMFAFYGRNPVFVTKDGLTGINLNLQKIKNGIAYEKSDQTIIKCILTHNGKPLSGAMVFAAIDLNEGMQTKGFVQSGFSDKKGEASIQVDTGRYYLTARKRVTGMFGPMSEGDLIGFFHKNPIVIKDAGTYTVNIELVEIPKKVTDDFKNTAKTIISGTITDESGMPVQGLWIGAYKDQQMFGKPVYLSKKSDLNGDYTFPLPKAGKYYLAARNTLGGPPGPGDLYGSYDGTDDHSITIKTGEKLTGVNITIMEMW